MARQKEEVVCSCCIKLFDSSELTLISRVGPTLDAHYYTPYCDSCIEKEKIPKDRIKGSFVGMFKEE